MYNLSIFLSGKERQEVGAEKGLNTFITHQMEKLTLTQAKAEV